MTAIALDINQQRETITQIFNQQKANLQAVANTTASQRIAKLKKLHQLILANKEAIREAAYKDFRKNPSEVDLTETYAITNEIKHNISHLRNWMRDRKVSTPMALLGSSSYIRYEPKGNALIISPWNFPFNLTFCPLISAIAAGNCVMVKPSENTPHSSALIKKVVEQLFDKNEVAVVEGAVETSTALLEMPFNHVFFTGAPAIGKIVMRAAANHLASVTLELGGKSPTIIDETANINRVIKRIVWAKMANNGQICIAPDYAFVHESKLDEFVKKFKETTEAFYSSNAADSDAYCRIVNTRHFGRLKNYLEDAIEKGAKVEMGGKIDDTQDYIAPTLLTNVSKDSAVMTNEIFGPILPILTYKNIQEVIDYINAGEKPLALYMYSSSRKNQKKVIDETRSGAAVINHSAVHFFNGNLPFGGANNSGIGNSHGFFGFEAFSDSKGVMKQWSPMSALELMMPPYTGLKQKLIDLSIKWF